MFVNLVYNKLNLEQKKIIKNFILNNFNKDNELELILEPHTIIIINFEESEIKSCVCFLNNNLLKKKLNILKISDNGFNIKNYKNGIFLYNFCVDKNCRGKQYGTKIIEYSIELFKNLNIEYIHCQAENDISKKIFLKNNFIINKEFNNLTLMTKLL
jgi:hypothetical protein